MLRWVRAALSRRMCRGGGNLLVKSGWGRTIDRGAFAALRFRQLRRRASCRSACNGVRSHHAPSAG